MSTAGTHRKGRDGGAGSAAHSPRIKAHGPRARHTDTQWASARRPEKDLPRGGTKRLAKASPPLTSGARHGQAVPGQPEGLSVRGNQVHALCFV